MTIFWFSVWEILSLIVPSDLILPSPFETAKAFAAAVSDSDFYITALLSLCRISVGFAVGLLFGALLGTVCAFSQLADYIFKPLLNIIKSTPVSSFILLLLFWTSREYVPSFIAMLIVLPIIQSSVYEGIKSTDPLLIEMVNFFRVPKHKQILTVYAESVKSRLLASSTTALGLAWKAGIAAEVLATPVYAIGTQLYESKLYLETPRLFAWTALVILLSIALEKLILVLLKLIKRKTENISQR